ncbi:MAG: hypothetical protein ACYC8T_10305 [Myxococcaceae bacterium]
MSTASSGVKVAYNPAPGAPHGMNHFIEGILKIGILEATVAVIVVDRLLAAAKEQRFEQGRKAAYVSVAVLAVFAWGHFGSLRGGGAVVHIWEQFHFYLGAKYQKELGWFDIYKATLLADRESARVLGGVASTRDLRTFEVVPVSEALSDAARVRAAFSDERWSEFKRDWMVLAAMPVNWAPIISDHGNSESPAWSIVAHPVAAMVPLSMGGLTFIALLDMALMGALWWFVFRTFGVRAGSVALVVAASLPNVFDYTFGSFLRWDWFFALGMAMCFLKRGRFATAGAFFGFAVATKLFPLFFGVALLFQAAFVTLRERKVAVRYLRFGAGALGSLAAAVVISSVMLGTPRVWLDYKDRITVSVHEKYYPIQYSLKTVFLQAAASSPSEFADSHLAPRDIKQARADVNIADYALPFLLVQLLFTLFIAALAVRADEVSAFALGPFLVFTWLTVNMYYWHMLGLAALGLFLRKERPPLFTLLGLHAVLAIFYLNQHLGHGNSEPYLVALLLSSGIAAFFGAEAFALFRAGWRPWPAKALPATPK